MIPKKDTQAPASPPPLRRAKRAATFIDFWLGQQLRSLRKEKAMSLQDLANRCDLSVGTLSQIERGLSSASVKALSKISAALGISTNSLLTNIDTPEHDFHGWVARANQHKAFLMNDRKIVKEVISPASCQSLSLYKVRMQPGGATGVDLFVTKNQEVAGTIIEGVMELWIGSESVLLKAGDSFCYPGHAPRRWANPGETENCIIWAATRKP